ncbi:unnamed protein product, partial [Staurois parvus]
GGRRIPRRSGGHRDTRHDSGLRVNWYDRRHWVRHWMVWLDSGHRVTRHQVIWLDSEHRVIWQGTGTASSGKAVGSESTGMTAGTGSDIGSSDWTAGIGSPGIRSFGSTAGTASSGKAVVSESTGTTVGTGSSGTGLSGSTAGIGSSGIRSFGLPAGTASSGKAVGTES